mmetsp:Transcript_46312/g.140466  ORF Transcript_46312/g.140466 Transcript_46312/m.140466 type:complete len:310 (-) Transcript_46312:571-1500(-)
MMYTNWSKSTSFVVMVLSSLRISRTRLSTCSFASRPASTFRTMASISSTLTVPLRSRSKAQNADHSFMCDWDRRGFSAPATNSCRFTVPDPSRSRSSMVFSRSSICKFTSSLRMHWQISGTARTPSPLRSKKRKACSMWSTSRHSTGNWWAMTRITIRLKCPSLALVRMLLRRRASRAFGRRARGMRSHGWRSSALALGRSPAFTLSMLSTHSFASAESSDHSSPYSMPCVFSFSTRSSVDAAQCGGTPVSIWYTMQPRLHTSSFCHCPAISSKLSTITSSQATSGGMNSTSSCRGCSALLLKARFSCR